MVDKKTPIIKKTSPLLLSTLVAGILLVPTEFVAAKTWKKMSSGGDTILNLTNRQVFTSAGSFTVPAGIKTVYVTAIGGGGGGGVVALVRGAVEVAACV